MHFVVIAEIVPIFGIPKSPILIFLYEIFITASSPVSHTHFCPGRENKKQPWGEIEQNDQVVRNKVNQLRKYACQNGHIPL